MKKKYPRQTLNFKNNGLPIDEIERSSIIDTIFQNFGEAHADKLKNRLVWLGWTDIIEDFMYCLLIIEPMRETIMKPNAYEVRVYKDAECVLLITLYDRDENLSIQQVGEPQLLPANVVLNAVIELADMAIEIKRPSIKLANTTGLVNGEDFTNAFNQLGQLSPLMGGHQITLKRDKLQAAIFKQTSAA